MLRLGPAALPGRQRWGARMGAQYRRAAIVAVFVMFAPSAKAAESELVAPGHDAAIVETSTRLRFGWTEFAFAGNHPKAWDDIVSPEFRISLRVLDGLFEGKLEIDGYADRFNNFERLSTDNARSELQLEVDLRVLSENGKFVVVDTSVEESGWR